MLFFSISLTMGFASCSDDDDDNGTEDVTGAKEAGEKFVQDIQAYQALEGTSPEVLVKKAEAAAKIYADYQTYSKNKENKEWKEAFLKGAAKEDLSKYETLNNFLEKDYSSPTGIADAISELANLFKQN